MFFFLKIKIIYLKLLHILILTNITNYPKMIALYIRNATVANLEKWFVNTECILSNDVKNHIRHCITTSNGNID